MAWQNINIIPKINTLRHWFNRRKAWQKATILTIVFALELLTLHKTVEFFFFPVPNPSYGVSFSIKYAEELGLDWKETLTASLDDLGFRRFRMMSYWDLHEKEPGKYDFADLDWQLDEVAKRGGTVSLGLGLRQPRWPECHQPQWAKDIYGTDKWQPAMDEYITQVVKRYKAHPAIESWQLENEALNNWFGECEGAIDRGRLLHEIELVKQLDTQHPLIMSLSDQHGLPLGEPTPDIYGFSVYRVVYNDKGPFHFYLTYPTPIWYHRMRVKLINWIKQRPVMIHELQVEPWGPTATKDMSLEEQERSMSLEQAKENIEFARKIYREDIFTWGVEWWYWRKTKFNDGQLWEMMKAEIKKHPYSASTHKLPAPSNPTPTPNPTPEPTPGFPAENSPTPEIQPSSTPTM